jgi:hypothetical protein
VALLAAFGYSIIQQQEFLFELSPEMACRAVYGRNPFPESIEIANYIKADSAPSDRIAVIGSEPQIFFYADRRSATGYIYTYGMLEQQKYALTMQQGNDWQDRSGTSEIPRIRRHSNVLATTHEL